MKHEAGRRLVGNTSASNWLRTERTASGRGAVTRFIQQGTELEFGDRCALFDIGETSSLSLDRRAVDERCRRFAARLRRPLPPNHDTRPE